MINFLEPVERGVKFYDGNLTTIPPVGSIFVFGGNLAGRHVTGAALHALKHHGATYGKGVGLQGNSYGIPTKDASLNVLDIAIIDSYIKDFVRFVLRNQQMHFYVTALGTGLAGYKHQDMAPLFEGLERCWLPLAWKEFLAVEA